MRLCVDCGEKGERTRGGRSQERAWDKRRARVHVVCAASASPLHSTPRHGRRRVRPLASAPRPLARVCTVWLASCVCARAAAAAAAGGAAGLEVEGAPLVVFHGRVVHALELSQLEVLEDAYLGGAWAHALLARGTRNVRAPPVLWSSPVWCLCMLGACVRVVCCCGCMLLPRAQ